MYKVSDTVNLGFASYAIYAGSCTAAHFADLLVCAHLSHEHTTQSSCMTCYFRLVGAAFILFEVDHVLLISQSLCFSGVWLSAGVDILHRHISNANRNISVVDFSIHTINRQV